MKKTRKQKLEEIFFANASPEEKLAYDLIKSQKKVSQLENLPVDIVEKEVIKEKEIIKENIITGDEIIKKINEVEMITSKQIDFGHIRNFPWHLVKSGGEANFMGYGAYDLNIKPITLGQITANQNNYVTGLGGWFRISSDAARTITGFEKNIDDRGFVITNVGSFNITLANQSASSSAAYRIITSTGADVVLAPDEHAWLLYDSTTERWRVITSFSGIFSLNGLVTAVQTFTNDTNVTITSAGSTHTLGWSGTLAVSRGGTGASSFTAGSVIFSDGTNLTQNNADFFWDNTLNRLILNQNTTAPVSPFGGILAHLQGQDSTNTMFLIEAHGTTTRITARAAPGTSAAPTNAIAGTQIVSLEGYSYGTTGWSSAQRASIVFSADEIWSDTAQGTRMTFTTTTTQTTSNTERMRIDMNGFVGVGTTAPAARLHLGGNISKSAWTTNGICLRTAAATYTDTSSVAGTIAAEHGSSIGIPTFDSTNAITITDAANFYIVGAAAQTGNVTITNAWSLEIALGRTLMVQNVVNDVQLHMRGSRAAIVSGDILGGINFWSNDTNLTAPGTSGVGLFTCIAVATHTASVLDSAFQFKITKGTTVYEALRIAPITTALGGLSVNTGAAPTAQIEIAAGTATASTAPLKFTAGTNLTTAVAGVMEYDGTNLFFTRTGTTRGSLLQSDAVNSVSPTAPNRTVTVNIGGTLYYLAAKTTND